MDRHGPLSSHAPLSFASTPVTLPETTSKSAARLLFKSHWSFNTESAREEPRLRRLLGHISVYDRTNAFVQAQTEPIPTESRPEQNELFTYLLHQVPSFEEFRAEIKIQQETIAQIRLTTAAQYDDVDEYSSDEEETDSHYDSLDGDDWSEEDIAADSDDSFTDNGSEGQTSRCTSPTLVSADANYDKEEDDIWAIQPLTPFLNSSNRC
jgi:hypothetical protein